MPRETGIGPSEQKPVDWDRTFITGRAYGNDQKLSTRQSIYAFAKRSSQPGFFGWGVSRIAWSGTDLVVDVGCGNGMWLKRLANAMPGARTVGLGPFRGHAPKPRRQVGRSGCRARRCRGRPGAPASRSLRRRGPHDADALPRARQVRGVLAESRRVLRANGGAALVSTPGPRHLGEVRELLREL